MNMTQQMVYVMMHTNADGEKVSDGVYASWDIAIASAFTSARECAADMEWDNPTIRDFWSNGEQHVVLDFPDGGFCDWFAIQEAPVRTEALCSSG
jgi:hypothetical protein